MLVRHDVVFVFRVGRLVLGGHVDGFVGEVRGAVKFLIGGEGVVSWEGGARKRGRKGKAGGAGDSRWEMGDGRWGDTYFEEVSVAGLVEVDVGV